MRQFRRLVFLLLIASGVAHAGCKAPQAQDAAWMQETVELWRDVARDDLGTAGSPLPWIIFFDASCSWNINADAAQLPSKVSLQASIMQLGEGTVPLAGYAHEGEVRLPAGGSIPPQLMLFASTYGDERKPYMVMAMPAIWRATEHHADDDARELDALIRSVFVHEMTHTAQSAALGSRIDAVIAEEMLAGDSIDDDMVQRDFGDKPDFVNSIDRERELLFAAFANASDEKARGEARMALDLVRKRHAHWFAGDAAYYATLEDTFLYLEGSANWAAYHALLKQGIEPDTALRVLRRDGGSWTQDEGLAIFLVIDRFLPGWQETAMSGEPGRLLDLLGKALATP